MEKKRIVLKVGSSIICDGEEISISKIQALCELIASLRERYSVILVTSGATASGYTKIKLDKSKMSNKQALAAIGQPLLMESYRSSLEKYNILTSQILLSAHTFDSRKECNFALKTINALLENEILPIINENDPIDIVEYSIGDNDRLSAFVTHYFNASMLVIFSDIDGYYTTNPHENKDAKLRSVVGHIQKEELEAPSSAHGDFATGGIVTKLLAADFLLSHGKEMFLCNGDDLSVAKDFLLSKIQRSGTLFKNDR